jgi:penicillin-binding protein 2
MAQRFGFGQKLGIDLPHERAGLIPGRAWKMATQGQPWQQGETLVAAIGQGYILVSPLQLATMSARIANGGRLIQPHIIKQPTLEHARTRSLGFDRNHIDYVQRAMSAVVNEQIGTAYAARIQDPDMAMAGKTGTSQVRHISEAEREEGVTKNENLPWKERDHALFTGFAPVEAPRYAVSVIIEHGGSGAHMAAPVARDILIECQKRKLA